MLIFWAVLGGFLLDAVFGDPVWLLHPVVLMGRCITALEKRLRAALPKTPQGELAGGCVVAAVLPLLETCEDTDFLKAVIKSARNQAVYYPDYLKPPKRLVENLTESEMQVLRLICADKSNSEIGEILNIRLTTVKSHVSHILQKLSVNRRSEAKTMAGKLHLL